MGRRRLVRRMWAGQVSDLARLDWADAWQVARVGGGGSWRYLEEAELALRARENHGNLRRQGGPLDT